MKLEVKNNIFFIFIVIVTIIAVYSFFIGVTGLGVMYSENKCLKYLNPETTVVTYGECMDFMRLTPHFKVWEWNQKYIMWWVND